MIEKIFFEKFSKSKNFFSLKKKIFPLKSHETSKKIFFCAKNFENFVPKISIFSTFDPP